MTCYQSPLKYYVAASYRDFRAYAAEKRLKLHDSQYIRAGDKSKVMGLALTPDRLEIIGDPPAPWSFWQYLMFVCMRIEKNG